MEIQQYESKENTTEVTLNIGAEPENNKTFIINVPMDITARAQVIKLLLGYDNADEQSTNVAEEKSIYKSVDWPIMLSKGVWLWTVSDSDLEEVLGEERASQLSFVLDNGTAGLCISSETERMVLVKHYPGPGKTRQAADSIISDLNTKNSFMIEGMVRFRLNTVLVKLAVDEHIFANSTKMLFNFNVTSYDRAERVYGGKTVCPPAVHIKGPNNAPRSNFLSLANQFGTVVYCERIRKNLMEDVYLVFFKHPDSAKLITGIQVKTKGGLMVGTTEDKKEDLTTKTKCCGYYNCGCSGASTTRTCFDNRVEAAKLIKKQKFTETELEAVQLAFLNLVPKGHKHPANDQITT